MSAAAQAQLEAGRAYRTRDLRRYSANPSRLARRLVTEGKLARAAHGLYYAPVPSDFGPLPATDEELLRAFLGGARFILTGPPYWNALGLGSTAMFATKLVYNLSRSGEFLIDRRRFLLRRVYFPDPPTAEWYIVDLLQHHEMAGVAMSTLREGLVASLRLSRWDRPRLHEMAKVYGNKATLEVIEAALEQTAASAA